MAADNETFTLESVDEGIMCTEGSGVQELARNWKLLQKLEILKIDML